MYDAYKRRMAARGKNMSEMLRMQSNMVIEQTWDRDPNYRQVYVVKVDSGLPEVTVEHELTDVKFNVDTYQKVGANEPAYHLQFRHGAEKLNPDIGIGSYVYMSDEDGEWKWWMITTLDERPQFRQYTINECNWKFGWVVDGKIYYHLGILRNGNSNREADDNSYTSVVNGNAVAWMATNDDTRLIDYKQRFLISDYGRKIPLCFGVGNIMDTIPIGITQFVLSQQTFDPSHDNADLMLANYYDTATVPIDPDVEVKSSGMVEIAYSGTKPTIKVGGSVKTFTPTFSLNGTVVDKWVVRDANGEIGNDTNYTMERDGELLKLRVSKNYYLVGQILVVQCVGTDGSSTEVSIEIVG